MGRNTQYRQTAGYKNLPSRKHSDVHLPSHRASLSAGRFTLNLPHTDIPVEGSFHYFSVLILDFILAASRVKW